MRAAVVTRAIDPASLVTEVANPAHGAIVLFLGTVRDVNDGRGVSALEYSAYEAMAERQMRDIVLEAATRFGPLGIAVEHRVGRLELGETSVAIAVSHAHRGPAYDASRFVIEELKRRVPIWKREGYVDGTREWVGTADQRHEAAR